MTSEREVKACTHIREDTRMKALSDVIVRSQSVRIKEDTRMKALSDVIVRSQSVRTLRKIQG